MARASNRQIALKPQDLFVLLTLLLQGDANPTYPALAAKTGIAASAVHASLKRAGAAGLGLFEDGRLRVLRPQLLEFVLHGAKYAFPAVLGALTRGVPTSYAAAPLRDIISPSSDPVPVWPYADGSVRGTSFAPLYPSAPEAALRDEKLHALLALVDALRGGRARERNAAERLIAPYFA